MYKPVNELVADFSDTNITTWESQLDYELVQEIVGRSMSIEEWNQLIEKLDDIVFETVIGFRYD
jgi:hypothetical protein